MTQNHTHTRRHTRKLTHASGMCGHS